MPVPQNINFIVEQAEKPVHKRLIENGATSQLKPTKNSSIASGFDKISLIVNRQHLKIGK
ncbi:hypothetical protein [Microcoleus sp. D2_18a_B4]|uniref:hypothetical protein n=1 Tax=Microcoleus sp. D2_18a_B4 TaxID=3055329 RepID=UPI002FD546FC